MFKTTLNTQLLHCTLVYLYLYLGLIIWCTLAWFPTYMYLGPIPWWTLASYPDELWPDSLMNFDPVYCSYLGLSVCDVICLYLF